MPWNRLARASLAEQGRVQAVILRRHVRERVYPFSAHYRRVFDASRVGPEDIRGIDDLRRLPFTTKADLLAAQSDEARKRDFVLAPNPEAIRTYWPLARKLPLLLGGAAARERLRREYTPNFVTFTTGRSSDPIVFAYTPHDLAILAESGARLLDVQGIHATDARIANLFPFAPHLAFWQCVTAGFETGRMMLSTGGGKVMGTGGNIKMLERLQPTVIIGTPGFVYHLLRETRERSVELSKVELVVLGAEKVPPGLKEKMAEALSAMGSHDVVILGTYGFTEARMAFTECPSGHTDSPGYHIYPDLGVFEVIDPKSLEPVKPGDTGELVYTPIDGRGTVVMRYRTGDLAVGGITDEPCPWCGRTVPRISSELSRASDQRSLALTKIKGTLVDLSALGALLSSLPEVEEWQVVLQKKHDDPLEVDEFVVRMSLRAGTDAAAFTTRCRTEIQEGIEVAPNRIELHSTKEMLELVGMETEMKEKRFLDRRPT